MWLAISGLPPKMWTPDTFTVIANHWGDVIVPEDCNPRQFNRTTGRVCILTKHLKLIHTTSYVPVDGSLILVRILEFDGDIDSLFNGYTIDSSSREEDDDEVDEDATDEDNDNDSEDELEEEDVNSATHGAPAIGNFENRNKD
ncbi:hypothetical protein Tco_0371001, partial [Tanacetum coccineum]